MKLKKGFPSKFCGIKIGWKDVGKDKRTIIKPLPKDEWDIIDGFCIRSNTSFHIHGFCGSTLRIGKEGGNIFYYCPLCLVKCF